MNLFCRYPIIILERIAVNDDTPGHDITTLGARSRDLCKTTKTALNFAKGNLLSEDVKVKSIKKLKNEASAIPPQNLKIEEQVTSSLISPFNEESVKTRFGIKDELLEIVPRVKIKKEFEEEEETIDNLAHHDLGSLIHSDDIALCEDIRPRRKAVKQRKSANSEVYSESGTSFDTVYDGSLSHETYSERPVKRQKAKAELSKLEPRDNPINTKKLSVILIDLFPKNSEKQDGINPSEGSFLCPNQLHSLKIQEGPEETNKFREKNDICQKKRNSNYALLSTDSLYSCDRSPAKFHVIKVLQNHLSAHCNEIASQDGTKAIKNANTERKFICDHCHSKFYSRGSIFRHIKRVHSAEIDGVKRGGKKFSKVHRGVGLFLCEHCDKSFKRKEVLKVHLYTVHSNTRPFPCSYCDKTFKIKSQAKIHENNIHLGAKPFLCSHCDKKLASKWHLKMHLRIHTKEKVFCQNCFKVFNHEGNLKEHKIHGSCEKFFWCKKCGRYFPQKSTLVEHLELHTLQEQFCCAHCDQKFRHRKDLREHIALHLDTRQISCKHCFCKFLDEGDLERHLATDCKRLRFSHALELSQEKEPVKNQDVLYSGKKYPCLHCDETFERECDLADHLALAVCTKLFSCEHCSQRFRTKIGVEKHMACHFGKIHEKFSCKSCGKNFVLKRTYEEHIVKGCSNRRSQNIKRRLAVPIAKKRFSCAHCSSTFSVKGNLSKHMNIHLAPEDRPFSCCLCPKKFTRKEHLQNHLTSHSDLKPFSCSKCPLKLKTKSDLRKHERSHSGERRFQCKLCPANYKRSSHLAHHLATHSNEKPFSCSLCYASFKRKQDLLPHIKRHDDNLKRFSCDVCFYKFHTVIELRNHVKVHRPGYRGRLWVSVH